MQHIPDEELFRLMDGECSATEEVTYKAHLSQCPACRALYDELFALNQQLAQLPLEKPSYDFTDAVMEKWTLSSQRWWMLGASSVSGWLMGVVGLFAGTLLLVFSATQGWLTTAAVPGMETERVTLLTTLQQWAKSGWLVHISLILASVLALLLFEKAVLQPYFRKRIQALGQ